MNDLRDVTRSARRWWALVAIAASVLVVGLDLTVLNLALPSMAVSLHAATGDLQWIVDSYSLVLAALILPAGLLGDRYGRKRMLLAALVLFGASSLACAYAVSTGELIAARAVLGVGAAAIFPLALSVLPVLFSAEERPKAVAAIAGATMLSFPIGPVLGGYDHRQWPAAAGMDLMLWTCGGIAVACALLAMTALRSRGTAVGLTPAAAPAPGGGPSFGGTGEAGSPEGSLPLR
jgi:MFS family permease